MSEIYDYWYTVHLTGAGGQPRIVDTLAKSKLAAEVDVIKTADESWPSGAPWSWTSSRRTTP